MFEIAEPDLIINDDGSVYHLCLKPQDLAETVVVVGDPQLVHNIQTLFTTVDSSGSNREFMSCTGYYKGKRITVLSTGFGTSNIDIAMHELDALVNFDLPTRKPKKQRKSLRVIHIGTSTSIQPDIPIDTVCLSTHGLGLDNLLWFYRDLPNVIDQDLMHAFSSQVSWPSNFSTPYIVKGSNHLIQIFSDNTLPCITVTAPGLYGPQGQRIRLDLVDPCMIEKLQKFNFEGHRILNIDMETSALYGLAALMEHEMVSLTTIIANRTNGGYNHDYKRSMNTLIGYILEKIALN